MTAMRLYIVLLLFCSRSHAFRRGPGHGVLVSTIRAHRTLQTLQANQEGRDGVGSAEKFVPVFVGVWAVGYTAITATQVFGYRLGPNGPSLESVGEFGGVASVALTVGLFLALFVAAAVEVFKGPDPQS